jgi:hypothetical protein
MGIMEILEMKLLEVFLTKVVINMHEKQNIITVDNMELMVYYGIRKFLGRREEMCGRII